MLNSKKFYSFPVRNGNMQFVNINNIASIEDAAPGCVVTLNVKDDKGQYIRFIADLPWSHVTGQIVTMDNAQGE